MNRFQRSTILLVAAMVMTASLSADAQQPRPGGREPRLGYAYPAGGRQGTAFEVTLGGQFLDGSARLVVSSQGVESTILKHTKPLAGKKLVELRDILQKARKEYEASRAKARPPGPGAALEAVLDIAERMGADREELKAVVEFQRQRADPKRQLNPQLSETLSLRVTVAPDAQPGPRELRLLTPLGLSNPLVFEIGRLPECLETEPNDRSADAASPEPIPQVLNGQILPGDVDRFTFNARKGTRLVAVASARRLTPYLADAVPGWFQATLSLRDAEGREVAYEDDYRFDPDPVLSCVIPATGRYTLEIHDAIYRGREDFVYRVALGPIPFVTSVFPLGGPEGRPTTVALAGWNLPVKTITLDARSRVPGVHLLPIAAKGRVQPLVPLAVDSLDECVEREPNDQPAAAEPVKPPVVVNGRIDKSGDLDVFCFEGRAGGRIAVEVVARRLGSPLDSLLMLTDAEGRQLAAGDDCEDKGAGLATHYADSRLLATLPQDGVYYLHLADAQRQGGPAYAYRLRVSARRPDFEIRVVPATLNVPAGAIVPITVTALRKDGFSGDIELALADAPPGFAIGGAWVPAGQDQVRLTLTVPPLAEQECFRLRLEGVAHVAGREIRRQAVPAEDKMQAFIYHHLVPAQDWMVAVLARPWRRPALRLRDERPARLPAGGTTTVGIAAPQRLPLGQLRFVASDPPDGVTIDKVSPARAGAAIRLRADAKKAKVGLKGNLIIEVFLERLTPQSAAKPQGQKQRVPLGFLPAIPFEITAPGATAGLPSSGVVAVHP